MLLAQVVLDIPSKSLDDSFAYRVPESEEFADISVGCAVKVSFGHRPCVGFVVDVGEGEGFEGLKDIEGLLSGSYFDDFGSRCAAFLSRTYVAPLSTCVRLFTPPGAVPKFQKDKEHGWRLVRPAVGQVDDRWIEKGPAFDEFEPRKNAVKQIAILDTVGEGDIKVSELSYLYGNVAPSLKALESKGAIQVMKRRRIRGQIAKADSQGRHDTYTVSEIAPDLSPSQDAAVQAIDEAFDRHDGRTVLVDGVTGSGKTEVYMRAIAHALDEGKSAILLVPEISLTPQTVARLRARFGQDIAVLHSKMGAGERFDQWELIRSGDARVVIGPRSALFAPVQDLGLIVIDEEHESTYKQESAPRYVSRDVASWMMRESGGTLVLGSATPSIDSLYAAHADPSWTTCVMPERANGRPMPKIEVIDMALEFRSGDKKMFSTKLRRAMVEDLSLGHKVVLLLNQRGFAKFLLCRDCGFVPKCKNCSTTLTYHSRGNMLMCHHCGHAVKAPAKCPECGSPYLRKFGVGTERVEAELRALLNADFGEMPSFVPVSDDESGLPSIAQLRDPIEGVDGGGMAELPKIVRMDADTTRGKGAHRRLLDEFASSPRAVLLGTQMIAKGLDFDEVTLVGVINADVQLHLPDFRSEERTFDLIEQVAGRAGRGSLPGRVMVQTYEADNVAIRAAASYDREMFLCTELPKRKVLGYPPFVRMANVVVWGPDGQDVQEAAHRARDVLCEVAKARDAGSVQVLRETECVLLKIRNDYRWHIVVKAPNDFDLPSLLDEAYSRIKSGKNVNMAFDVDPYDLL